jgi:uncharacterized damage-inducible protein DinB
MQTQLDFDRWSTSRLLELCTALPPEVYTRQLPIGPGSLEQLCRHIVNATFLFADRFNRQPHIPHYPGADPISAAQLLADFDQAAAALEAAVAQVYATHALTDLISWTDVDADNLPDHARFTYAKALAHMLDHGNHHRTQAMDMLQLLGRPADTNWHPLDWDLSVRYPHP